MSSSLAVRTTFMGLNIYESLELAADSDQVGPLAVLSPPGSRMLIPSFQSS